MNQALKDSYTRLKSEVKAAILQGKKRAESAVEREKVLTYWKVGRLINQHILVHKDRAAYGKQVIERLARDLEINYRTLYYALEFAREYPILNARSKLEWTHYRSLLEVKKKETRKFLIGKAEKENWTSRELEQEISKLSQNGTASAFIPRLGKLNTYRIVLFKDKLFALDLGFTAYLELNSKQARGFQEGDIVQGTSLSKLKKISSGEKTNLYTYHACLERVVDGDTLWMKIYLGFDIWIREKLRFRGLDTAEVDTKKGRAAKRFVEKTLAEIRDLIITTTKPDKYDRYLSDVWIGDANLNQLLLKKGLAHIKTSVRPQDWEG